MFFVLFFYIYTYIFRAIFNLGLVMMSFNLWVFFCPLRTACSLSVCRLYRPSQRACASWRWVESRSKMNLGKREPSGSSTSTSDYRYFFIYIFFLYIYKPYRSDLYLLVPLLRTVSCSGLSWTLSRVTCLTQGHGTWGRDLSSSSGSECRARRL